MNIWIDILHIPQFNFYKPLIKALSEQGHTVYITVLDRGKLPKIATRETEGWSNVKVYFLGKHKMTKWSAIWDANIIRAFQLRNWARDKKIDIGFSNGMLLAWVCKQKGIPNYSFDDDPQTMDRWGKEKWNTECNFCVYQDPTIKAPSHVLRCTKEWAYLNPRTFVPKEAALEKYGVKPKEYMFLREVSVGTINYAGQESGAILGIKDLIPSGMKVLFSLEEKKRRKEYPADWILLQEPIEDIHSLIYYSAGLVSSGDSMAREAALLGVPSYYLGIRYSMPANAAASKVASLQNRKTMPFEEWIHEYIEDKPQKNNPQSLDNDSQLSSPYSAHEQAPGQTNDPSIVANAFPDYSEKNTQKSSKKEDIADVVEKRMMEQDALRAKIDEAFIDINQYMLSLIEGKQKQ